MEPVPGPVPGPLREPAVAGRPRPIARRQIAPLRAGGEDPEDPVEDLPPVTRAASAVARRRQERLEAAPLRLGEIVPLDDLELGLHEAPTNA